MNTLDHIGLSGPWPAVGRPEPAGTGAAVSTRPAGGRGAGMPTASFADVLQRRLNERAVGRALVFSGHARDRLATRGISLAPQQLSRLQAGVDRAAGKGARDSLVLLDDLAFVVNVKSRTVITAVAGQSKREGVFTQIDSAVIA